MKLAQEYDTMFERNIAIIASRKQEVNVHLDGQLFEGYICGLDEIWLQIYGHEYEYRDDPEIAWRFCLINRDNILSITSSGRDLRSLNSKDREYVEKKIYNFSSVAKDYLELRKTNDDGAR